MNQEMKEIVIYTDGGCDPNPGGPGGYGVVLLHDKHRKELSGGFRATTNNRMELQAAIQGLSALKSPCRVTLYSDSKYLVDAMTNGWVIKWRDKNWWRTKKERAANIDLWEQMLVLCDEHEVTFEWVKGHNEDEYNERCDQLSTQALQQENLPPDEGYENPPEHDTPNPNLITKEGQPCRKCQTPVVKKVPRKKRKKSQAYYYEYYLYCTGCQTMYMVEDAKVYIQRQPTLF